MSYQSAFVPEIPDVIYQYLVDKKPQFVFLDQAKIDEATDGKEENKEKYRINLYLDYIQDGTHYHKIETQASLEYPDFEVMAYALND